MIVELDRFMERPPGQLPSLPRPKSGPAKDRTRLFTSGALNDGIGEMYACIVNKLYTFDKMDDNRHNPIHHVLRRLAICIHTHM